MTQCPIIQDLLPLYIDDALSLESRALVEEHLSVCADCRQEQTHLQNGGAGLTLPLPTDAAPSADARFLTRLKRQVGTVIGLSLMVLVMTAFVANQIGRSRADAQYGQKMEARRKVEEAALAAIMEASPDAASRLKAVGVELTASARHDGDQLRVQYYISPSDVAPRIMDLGVPGPAANPRLFDPATGKALGRLTQASSSTSPGKPTEGELRFESVPALPPGAKVELGYLAVYLKPEQELKWEFRRPGDQGNVTIGQRFAIAGVEFEVERVRFDGDLVQIDYRQVTPPEQVGLHLLSFRLSDRMGGNWGEDFRVEELPDPLRPSQRFEFVSSVSKNWSVQVEHAILALPGPAIPLEVK